MIFDLYAFTLYFAAKRGILQPGHYDQATAALRPFPLLVESLVNSHDKIHDVAKKHAHATSILYIGRGIHYPIALEGALKLKEISYIHAEGYAGGELKHGPIALIDETMPIVALAPRDRHYDKMIANVEEVVARGGQVIGIGQGDDEHFRRLCVDFIEIPRIDHDALQSILSTIPLQLFSYFVAITRGTDVDQPRNLAKSVTVE
jgi:glucosamine--fructose-6-phosphate aminotransferase (isomerizing)